MKLYPQAILSALALLSLIMMPIQPASSHCQVPCGIYDDQMRFDLVSEHITTIEKSMNSIVALEQEAPANHNQIVRWVNNKEYHADEIANIVSYYFLAQRIKPADPKDAVALKVYKQKLMLLHEMIIYAMKAKQTTDLANVEKLRSVWQEFHDLYFGPEHER